MARQSQERGRAPESSGALSEAFATGRRAWPTVSLPEEAFASYLLARLGNEPIASAAQMKAADLYLACAASRGDAAATAAFESTLLSRVGQFIAKIDRTPDFIAEVTQTLRIKLFVGSDGQGKLTQYSGRGTLESWVCAAALRTAHDLIRERTRNGAYDDHAFDVLAASDDVELEMLRSRYREHFRDALDAALAGLAARDRTLLRLYFVEGVTTARIGQIYGVHETTALRWIVRARDGIVEHVQAELQQKLALPRQEFAELMALLRSRIDITVRHLLRTTER